MIELAFVRVGNAGRSQLATALVEPERDRRDLSDSIEIVTGGVDPQASVHNDVTKVLREGGIDIGDRTQRRISVDDAADLDYNITMGCAVDDFAPPDLDGTAEVWELEYLGGNDTEAVRTQRDKIVSQIPSITPDTAV